MNVDLGIQKWGNHGCSSLGSVSVPANYYPVNVVNLHTLHSVFDGLIFSGSVALLISMRKRSIGRVERTCDL